MNGKQKLALVVGIIVVASLAIWTIALAQGEIQTLYPSVRLVNTEGELVFEGWFVENDEMSCIQMSNGNFFCCCGAGCSVEIDGTLVPKDPTPTRGVNDPTPTPVSPTDTPVTPPTDTPVTPSTKTPKPEPTRANCGVGNLDEGADPNENACGKKTGEENEPDGPPGQDK